MQFFEKNEESIPKKQLKLLRIEYMMFFNCISNFLEKSFPPYVFESDVSFEFNEYALFIIPCQIKGIKPLKNEYIHQHLKAIELFCGLLMMKGHLKYQKFSKHSPNRNSSTSEIILDKKLIEGCCLFD